MSDPQRTLDPLVGPHSSYAVTDDQHHALVRDVRLQFGDVVVVRGQRYQALPFAIDPYEGDYARYTESLVTPDPGCKAIPVNTSVMLDVSSGERSFSPERLAAAVTDLPAPTMPTRDERIVAARALLGATESKVQAYGQFLQLSHGSDAVAAQAHFELAVWEASGLPRFPHQSQRQVVVPSRSESLTEHLTAAAAEPTLAPQVQQLAVAIVERGNLPAKSVQAIASAMREAGQQDLAAGLTLGAAKQFIGRDSYEARALIGDALRSPQTQTEAIALMRSLISVHVDSQSATELARDEDVVYRDGAQLGAANRQALDLDFAAAARGFESDRLAGLLGAVDATGWSPDALANDRVLRANIRELCESGVTYRDEIASRANRMSRTAHGSKIGDALIGEVLRATKLSGEQTAGDRYGLDYLKSGRELTPDIWPLVTGGLGSVDPSVRQDALRLFKVMCSDPRTEHLADAWALGVTPDRSTKIGHVATAEADQARGIVKARSADALARMLTPLSNPQSSGRRPGYGVGL